MQASCPQCNKTYRITMALMEASQGLVRCGNCGCEFRLALPEDMGMPADTAGQSGITTPAVEHEMLADGATDAGERLDAHNDTEIGLEGLSEDPPNRAFETAREPTNADASTKLPPVDEYFDGEWGVQSIDHDELAEAQQEWATSFVSPRAADTAEERDAFEPSDDEIKGDETKQATPQNLPDEIEEERTIENGTSRGEQALVAHPPSHAQEDAEADADAGAIHLDETLDASDPEDLSEDAARWASLERIELDADQVLAAHMHHLKSLEGDDDSEVSQQPGSASDESGQATIPHDVSIDKPVDEQGLEEASQTAEHRITTSDESGDHLSDDGSLAEPRLFDSAVRSDSHTDAMGSQLEAHLKDEPLAVDIQLPDEQQSPAQETPELPMQDPSVDETTLARGSVEADPEDVGDAASDQEPADDQLFNFSTDTETTTEQPESLRKSGSVDDDETPSDESTSATDWSSSIAGAAVATTGVLSSRSDTVNDQDTRPLETQTEAPDSVSNEGDIASEMHAARDESVISDDGTVDRAQLEDEIHASAAGAAQNRAAIAMSRAPWVWLVVLVGALAGLYYQLSGGGLDRLTSNPVLRPLAVPLCKAVGCEVAPVYDISQLEVVVSRMNRIPLDANQTQDAAKITLFVLNRAQFPQPYPEITLTLNNRAGEAVGRRTYDPRTYLNQPQGDLPMIQPDKLGGVHLVLASPPEDAVGFEYTIVGQ